jgi:arabinofuranosyltransferase
MKSAASGFKLSCLLAVIFLALSLFFFSWVPDDAYISFCYAEHLARGDGLTFFPGEKVEGFSNLLWTLYLAAGSGLGAGVAGLAVFSSLLFGLGAAFLIRWLILSAGEFVPETSDLATAGNRAARMSRIGIGALPFVSFPLLFYATSGLETAAALFFFTLGAGLHLEAVRLDRPSRFIGSSWCFFLVSILRPEGVLFLVINSIFIWRHRGARGRYGLIQLLPYLVFALVLFWKYQYFGSLVPNTYYAKPGASIDYLRPLGRGLAYLLHFSLKSGFILLLPFLIRYLKNSKAGRIQLYLGSLLLGQILFIVIVGGDILRFDRFTLPLVPPLLALAWLGQQAAARAKQFPLKKFTEPAMVAIILIIGILNLVRIPNALSKYCFHDWMHAAVQKEIGQVLGRTLPSGATVVTNEVGAVAYYSGLGVIDMIGLTDATVSRILHQSYRKYGRGGSDWSVAEISRYLLARHPDCVLVPSYQPLTAWPDPGNRERMHYLWYRLFNDLNASGQYRRLGQLKIHDSKYLYLYVLKQLELEQPWPAPGPVSKCHYILPEPGN